MLWPLTPSFGIPMTTRMAMSNILRLTASPRKKWKRFSRTPRIQTSAILLADPWFLETPAQGGT